jgi:hypothetical protein
MKKTVYFVAVLLLAAPLSTVHGQTGIRPPQGWSLGLMGGAAAFTDMQRGSVRVFRPTASGLESRELARRVGAETSTVMAAHLAFWPSRNWGLRLHATYAPTRFETVMRESEAQYTGMPATSEERPLAGLDVITTDLQLLFRLPTIKNRVLPYGIVGGGAARYEVRGGDEPVPEEAAGEFDGGVKVRPAAVVGVGAMLPFRNRAFRLHFELTDHIAGTPIQGGQGQLVDTGDGTIEFDPQAEPPGDRRVSLTNAVRFMVGVSWSPRR